MSNKNWDLYPAFKRTLAGLFTARTKNILLAVSGGPDSMALWDLMERWKADHPGTRLIVGHVNHALRGRASDGDAAFVARRATALGTRCRVVRVSTRNWSRRNKRGIEESARILRYQALVRIAKTEKCPVVIAAHTLDDQVETFFMNLIRGTGPSGLAAMSPDSTWPTGKGPKLLRPLLNVLKSDILLYLRRRKLLYRTDATNHETVFFRNRLRPMLRQWDKWRPGFFTRVGRLTEMLQVEEDFWEKYLGASLRRPSRKGKGGTVFDLGQLKKYHPAVQRRVLRRAGYSDFKAVEEARVLSGTKTTAVRRKISRAVLPLSIPGQIIWRNGDGSSHSLNTIWVDRLPADWKGNPRRVYLDAEAVDVRSLCRRFWRPGDRFQPLGMSGHKKLSDYFTDAKVPAAERGCVPLVADARGILWVAGHRVSERAKIAPSTRRILELSLS